MEKVNCSYSLLFITYLSRGGESMDSRAFILW